MPVQTYQKCIIRTPRIALPAKCYLCVTIEKDETGEAWGMYWWTRNTHSAVDVKAWIGITKLRIGTKGRFFVNAVMNAGFL